MFTNTAVGDGGRYTVHDTVNPGPYAALGRPYNFGNAGTVDFIERVAPAVGLIPGLTRPDGDALHRAQAFTGSSGAVSSFRVRPVPPAGPIAGAAGPDTHPRSMWPGEDLRRPDLQRERKKEEKRKVKRNVSPEPRESKYKVSWLVVSTDLALESKDK